ncbi:MULTISPECIES: hypothetical protein [unclassified Acinetobacter]|uniref:hypothetical protein n=1 Tax=unclassified Acinetobacter TaxID=196816 RepID=UPI00235DF7E4|nr:MULTISPECIES: hypothetical protein [unclassified Acinetobacter]
MSHKHNIKKDEQRKEAEERQKLHQEREEKEAQEKADLPDPEKSRPYVKYH